MICIVWNVVYSMFGLEFADKWNVVRQNLPVSVSDMTAFIRPEAYRSGSFDMNISGAHFTGLDGALSINSETACNAMQTAQEELTEEERHESLAVAVDAVNISPVARTLVSGVVATYEEAMDLLGMTAENIVIQRNSALNAHTGLDAYRAARLLEGLD